MIDYAQDYRLAVLVVVLVVVLVPTSNDAFRPVYNMRTL